MDNVIVSTIIEDDVSAKSAHIADLLMKNPDGSIKTVGDDVELSISNAIKLGGQTLEQVRSGIDAQSVGGMTPIQLMSQERFYAIAKLPQTKRGMFPAQWMAALTQNNEVLFWGFSNYTFIFGDGFSADNNGVYTVNLPHEKRNVSIKDIYTLTWALWVLYEDGDLYCTGINTYGQLGLGHTTTTKKLTLSATNVKSFHSTSEGYHQDYNTSFIIKNDGSVWGCGVNGYGQLGDGTITSPRMAWQAVNLPANVGTPIDVVVSDTNLASVYILTSTGKVCVSGANQYGELGLGHTTNVSTFTKNGILDPYFITKIVKIGGTRDSATTAYYNHAVYALTDTGRVFVCGHNGHGNLCLNDTVNRNVFTEILYPSLPYDAVSNPIVDIITSIAGWNTVYMLTRNGDLFGCGYNDYGQLSQGNTTQKNTLTFMTGNVDKLMVVSSGTYSYHRSIYVLKLDNTLWSCGYNGQGQLGLCHVTSPVTTLTQIMTHIGEKIVDMAFGGYSSDVTAYFLLDDGRVFAVGSNDYQQVTPYQTSDYISSIARTI